MVKPGFFLFWVLMLPLISFAQTPSVASFGVSPSSGVSGYPFSFEWTLADAGGSLLVVSCGDGVFARNPNTGTALACNSKISSPASFSGSMLIELTNISGLLKTIPVKLTPKDSSGAEYGAQSKTVYATVSPDPDPILSFNASTSTITSGSSATFSWEIPKALGANISVGCVPGLVAASPDYTGDIPCGKKAFSPPFSKKDSVVINFTNSSQDPVFAAVTLSPLIAANVYNGVNAETLEIKVASKYIPDPLINFFNMSPKTDFIRSGEEISVSWSAEYSKGVNIKISCADGVTATSSKNPEVLLPCGEFAFGGLLPASGNIKLAFLNKAHAGENLILSLIPSFKNKEGYDATKTKTISVVVKPPAASGQRFSAPPTATPSSSPNIQGAGIAGKKSGGGAGGLGAGKAGASATTSGSTSIPGAGRKDISSILEKLFSSNANREKIKEILSNAGKLEEIKRNLVDKKAVDKILTALVNLDDASYDIVGYRSGKLLFFIPVKVKISLAVDADGNIKSEKKPWWSFLVSFKK